MFTIFGRPVDASRRADMAEFVVLPNFGMTVDGIELDVEEGQLRFAHASGSETRM